MNKLPKQLRIVLPLIGLALMFLINPIHASAAQGTIDVNFNEFTFQTDDYNNLDVATNYYSEGDNEVVELINSETGERLEVIKLEQQSTTSRSGATAHTLTRRFSIGEAATVSLTVNVELYTSDSFRQINSIQGSYLAITNSVSSMRMEGSNINHWSSDGFPTTSIKYAANGTLVSEVDTSVHGDVSGKLLGSGFSAGASQGSTTYYRHNFNRSGTISIDR